MCANKGLLFRGFLAFSLILTGLVALAQGEPSGSAAEIVVEEADTILTVKLIGSSELAQAASEVSSRIVVDHAAISSLGTLSGSKELEQAANQVVPRIVIENAATSSLWQDLEGSAELKRGAYEVSPRILIEHAEFGTFKAPSAPTFQPLPKPDKHHPSPSPLFWVAIGLAVGLLIAFLVWRSMG